MIEPQIENIKNYKILNLIGEGSFGKVFRAADRNNENIVALKILSKVSEIIENLTKYKFHFSTPPSEDDHRKI